MSISLTARMVAAETPPTGYTAKGKEIMQSDLWDSRVVGLGLRVSRSGSKSWTLRYRIGRRQRRMTLGPYPTLSLADARQQARAALRDAALGVDPARVKHEQRDADTFGELADRFIEEHAKPKKKSWKEDQRLLKKDVLPHWRHRPAQQIQRRDVREIVDAVARRGAPIMANRLRAMLHKVFAFGVQVEIVDFNPVTGTPRPGVERQRDRVLTEDEIRTLWEATEQMVPPMAAFFRLRLVTAQRGSEVGDMRWSDVDMENGVWTIPAERSKNGLAHRVPLADLALEILAGLEQRGPGRRVLVGALGNRQRSEAAQEIPVENFVGHDLRRTAASCMASAGVPRLHIAKVLNHAEQGVTAVYDRHSYDPEKRVALDTWARKLTAILEKADGAKVVPFTRG